jgi:NAD(P)-dependent dehydrogenase (short-subunit alcohol dehydrogenase family)
VRDPARARPALAGLPGSVEVRQLDVADLGSVRAFARAFGGPLDVLVNNAGVMDIPAQRTADGFDLQTATNYFGPFVLTNLLLDRITDRVVSVASWRARPDHPMQAYCDSKLAVVLLNGGVTLIRR